MSEQARQMPLDSWVSRISEANAMPEGGQKRAVLMVTRDLVLIELEEGTITRDAGELLLRLLDTPPDSSRPNLGPSPFL